MNNDAEHPGNLDSLRMREGSQAQSLSKHVEKLERILDMVAPKLATRKSHPRTKSMTARHHEKVLPLQSTESV